MAEDQTSAAADAAATNPADLQVGIAAPERKADMVTILGLAFALGLIVVAILIGNSNANFFNLPAICIVVFGTIAATAISYSWEELRQAGGVIGNAVFYRDYDPQATARELMDLATLARKYGLLALSQQEQLSRDPDLQKAVQIVTDGYNGDDVERVLLQDLEALSQRHSQSAGILRRAAEVAPAMGLIGTLVGLVQMLANLSDPENIGPNMAVALLTTFYGAILSTVVFGPMAAKLERNSGRETLIRLLVLMGMSSIARQENPRRLEMLLNSELPPEHRIRYFE